MTNINAQHPVMVYGTLRPGGHNYGSFLQGHTYREQNIRVRGFNMYGGVNNGFPYVTAGDDVITATLVNIKPDHYDHVMMMLDFLEGYGGAGKANHYERKLATIRDENGEKVQAWVYILEGSDAELVARNYPKTKLGDWLLQKEFISPRV